MTRRLGDVRCPVYQLQGSADPVVDPRSAERIYEKLTGSAEKSIDIVDSERHGILNENIGRAQDLVLAFVESLGADGEPPEPLPAGLEVPAGRLQATLE
jgi:esterase/lipase